MGRDRERVIDEILVLRCREGDRESFDLLVRRWQRRLWRFARGLTGSDDAAWDATQEAWIAILKRIKKLTDPAWFPAWAYRIVRNKCADQHRRAFRERGLATSFAEKKRTEAPPPGDGTGPCVGEALRRLPEDRREILTLKYREDLSVLEIAVILGVPAGTVKSRLHHAREHLRRIIEGDQP